MMDANILVRQRWMVRWDEISHQ